MYYLILEMSLYHSVSNINCNNPFSSEIVGASLVLLQAAIFVLRHLKQVSI